MTTAIHLCPHRVNIYEQSCSQCRQEYAQFEKAKAAVDALGQGVNGGSIFVTAAALNGEHAYLFNQLATAMALSTLRRTYNSLCAETGTIFTDEPHPEHDGRLGCGTVIGALRTLAVKRTDDVLASREFWLAKVYEAPY